MRVLCHAVIPCAGTFPRSLDLVLQLSDLVLHSLVALVAIGILMTATAANFINCIKRLPLVNAS